MSRRPAALALGVGLAVGATIVTPAQAHPHVWITDVTTFLFEGRALVGLRHQWAFDTMFSSFVIRKHDQNKDGKFDPAETKTVIDGAFSNLAEFGYFTRLRRDGDPVELKQVEDFQASTSDGTLIYEFTLPLPEPIDPGQSDLAVGVYDPEYYVEVLLDEHDPVRFSGLPSGACTFEIHEDVDNPIYFGMVYPLAITLNCATS